MQRLKPPVKQGLYDPKYEHDACGIGFIADLKKEATHQTVKNGISMLCRLEHRGSQGGDGAGILIQLPHSFFQKACSQLSNEKPGSYGVGMVFLPQDSELRRQCEKEFVRIVEEEGLKWH